MSKSFWATGGGDYWGPSEYERRLALQAKRRRAVGALVGYIITALLVLALLAWLVLR